MTTFQPSSDDLGHEERSLHERLAAAEAQLAAYQQAATLMEAWKDAAGSQLLTILNKFASGMLLISADGRLLFANPRAAAMFDLHPDEMIGRYVDDLLPPELAQLYQERTQACFASDIPHEYERTFTLPGGTRTLFIANQMIVTSQGDVLLSTLIDSSSCTRIEAELGIALTKYRTLFDAMPLGIVCVQWYNSVMKLSEYAQKVGVRYETAWRWFKAGTIRGHQLPTGTIIITEDEPTATAPTRVAIYARVSAAENKANLDTQADRVASYCAAKGYQVHVIVKEVGSGVNDHRPKFLKLLADPTITKIVVEHKDRATRFGFPYIETLLSPQGRCIEVLNLADNGKEDLLHDLVAIVSAFAARLYGQRRAKRKTDAIVKELTEGTDDAHG